MAKRKRDGHYHNYVTPDDPNRKSTHVVCSICGFTIPRVFLAPLLAERARIGRRTT